MLNKIALEGALSTAAQQFGHHDSNIARYLSSILSEIEVKNFVETPTSVQLCSVLSKIFKREEGTLVNHISACYRHLSWRHPGFGKVLPAIAERMAVVEIVGPDGMIFNDRYRFGLLLQDRDTYYPKHQHAAEELYFILSGTAKWAVEDNAPKLKGAGEFIHHKPHEPHSILTEEKPLLTMWGWVGDIASASYTT